MNSILSIFETAVADYLLSASMAALVLVAVAWGLVKMRRVESSANRHMIWLFALVAIVILPAIWLHGPKLRLTVLPAGSSVVETASQPVNVDFTAGPMVKSGSDASVGLPAENVAPEVDASPSFRLPPIMTLLAIGWGTGFLLMLIRLAVGGVKLRHLLRTAEAAPDTMGFDTGGRRRIDLRLSSKVDCPVCFGLLRPVILMPKKMYDDARPNDLRMILHHELAHIERKDCWINLFQRLVEVVLFFHPLVWYASFQLTQQREELCDQHVIAGGASPENYVELLGRIAREGFEKRTLQAVALFEGRLLSRVQSLLGLGGRLQIKASRKAIGILAAAAMLCLAVGTVRLEARADTAGASDAAGDPQTAASFQPQKERLGPTENRPVGDCSLSGRVVSAVTGEPVGNATVYLFYVGTHDPIFIKTAGDGSFSFDDIPSGQYGLRVIKTAGFQNAVYDPEENATGGVGFFSMVEGEKRSGIVFKLEPACSISGRVLGEDGQAITGNDIEVLVWKARGDTTEGLARYELEGQSPVDPDGSYSLDGLSGAPVYVMAIDWMSDENDESLPPCYYPGTVSREDATLVDFNKGSARGNIDIQWIRKGSVILEGVVSDEATGAPVANALVTVHHTDMLFDYISVYTDEAGQYRVDSLGGGEFMVHIDAKPWGYVRTRQPVALESGKNARLDFTLRPAAAISGIFIDEDGEPMEVYENASGHASTIYYTAESREMDGGSWTSTNYGNKYSEKGIREERQPGLSFRGGKGDYNTCRMVYPTAESFLLEAILPGETILSFEPKEDGMEVKKILLNGEDITRVMELPEGMPPEMGLRTVDAVLETKPGENIEGVAIMLGPVVNSPSL